MTLKHLVCLSVAFALFQGCAPSADETPQTPKAITAQKTPQKMDFWNTTQRGANSFNKTPPDQAYFEALRETGASWVRLTFSKWDGDARDFLMGSADQYETLQISDLKTLKQVLDAAHSANIKVVLVPLSLPGARWVQHNDGTFDDRLWSDKAYWVQAAQFWADLAIELKDHPAVAAYNIINEPAPEKTQALSEYGTISATKAFLDTQEGTARHLLEFYEFIVSEIRKEDSETPIMVDAGYYANPINLAAWPAPLTDKNTLYAVHIYEPYQATSYPNTQREVPLSYPGTEGYYKGEPTLWNKPVLSDYVQSAYEWAKQHELSNNRIVIGEYGCVRTWKDCGSYLTDLLDIFDTHEAHWAYYTFRPDEWDAMDYELPLDFRAGQFYWYIQEGRKAKLPRDGELSKLINDRIKP